MEQERKLVSNKVIASRLRKDVFSIVEKANLDTPHARHITKFDALTVVQRSLEKTEGLPNKERKFRAIRELSDFITLSQKNKTSFQFPKNTDLLTVGHPRSTAAHAYSLQDYLLERAKWITADFSISEEAKPLIASAIINPCDSAEYKYAITRLTALPQGSVSQEALLAAIGDGNSTAARRARAEKQRRDRYGRFAFMGGGVRALLRGINGDVRSFTGKYVADAPRDGYIQVEAPDGAIYEMPSNTSEFIKAVINPTEDGFSPVAAKYSSEDPVVDLADVKRVEAPNGWTRINPDNEFQFTDGAFNVKIASNAAGERIFSVETADDNTQLGQYTSWADVQSELRGREVELAGLKKNDDGTDFDDAENRWAKYPENAYQLSRYVGYLSQGVGDGVEGATDNPRELAARFSKQDLVGALEEALSPIQDVPANGRGLLGFEGGLQDIKAEAIYQALRMQGEDADAEVARIYDELLGTNENKDALAKERGEAKDLAGEITQPDLLEGVDSEPISTAYPADVPLPELLQGLTESEQAEVIQTGDYRDYLPENSDIQMPEGYYRLNTESIDPTSEDFININNEEDANRYLDETGISYPIGYTDQPIRLTRFSAGSLEAALRSAVEPSVTPGYGELAFLNDEGDTVVSGVPAEMLRDALQLRGVDTDEILKDISQEGFKGQSEEVSDKEAKAILDEEVAAEEVPTGISDAELQSKRDYALNAAKDLRYGEEVQNAIAEGKSYAEVRGLLDATPSRSGYASLWAEHVVDYDSRHWVDLPRAAQRQTWASIESVIDYLGAISERESSIESTPETKKIVDRVKEPVDVNSPEEKEVREKIADLTTELVKQVDALEELSPEDTRVRDLQDKINLLNQANSELRAQLDALTNKPKDSETPKADDTEAEKVNKFLSNGEKSALTDPANAEDLVVAANDYIENSKNPRNALPTPEEVVEENAEAPFILNATPEELKAGDIITKDHFVISEVRKTTAPNGKDMYTIRGYYPGHSEQTYPERMTSRRQLRVYRNADAPEAGDLDPITQPNPQDYLDGRRDPDFIEDNRMWRREVLRAKRQFSAPQDPKEFVWTEDVELKDKFWYRFVMHYNRNPLLEEKMKNLVKRLEQVGDSVEQPEVEEAPTTPVFKAPKTKVVSVDNEENKPKETSDTQKVNEEAKETISTPEDSGNVEVELPATREEMERFALLYWEEMMQKAGTNDPMPEDFPETLRRNLGIELFDFTPQNGATLVWQGTEDGGQWVWRNPDRSYVTFDLEDPTQVGEMRIGRVYKAGVISDSVETEQPDFFADEDEETPAPAPAVSFPQAVDSFVNPVIPENDIRTRRFDAESGAFTSGEPASRTTERIPQPNFVVSDNDRSPYDQQGYRNRIQSLLDNRRRPMAGDPYRIWQEDNFVFADGINQARRGDVVNHWGGEENEFRGWGDGTIVALEHTENPGDRLRTAYAWVYFPSAVKRDQDGNLLLDANGQPQRGPVFKKLAVRMLFLNRRGSADERQLAEDAIYNDRYMRRQWQRIVVANRQRNPEPVQVLPREVTVTQTPTPAPAPAQAPRAQAAPVVTQTEIPGSEPIGLRFINRPLESRTPADAAEKYDGSIKNVSETNFNYVDPNKVQGDISPEAYVNKGWSAKRAAVISHAANSRPSRERLVELATKYSTAPADTREAAKKEFVDELGKIFGVGTAKFGKKNFTLEISSVSVGAMSTGVEFYINDENGRRIGTSRRTFNFGTANSTSGTNIDEGILTFGDRNSEKGTGFGEAWKAYYDAWMIANGIESATTHAAGSGHFIGAYVWTGFGYGWNSPAVGLTELKRIKPKIDALKAKQTKTLDDLIAIRDYNYHAKKAADALNISQEDLFTDVGRSAVSTVSESVLESFPTPRDLALIGFNPLSKTDNWFGKKHMINSDWYGKKRYSPDNLSLLQQEAEAYEYKRRRDSKELDKTQFKYSKALSDWFADENNYSDELKPYFDEVSTLFRKRTDNTVSLLSAPARRLLYIEALDKLSSRSGPASTPAGRERLLEVVDSINRDRIMFENPVKENYSDYVTDTFNNLTTEDLDNLLVSVPEDGQGPIILFGEQTRLIGERLNHNTGSGINSIIRVTDPETGKIYYVKRQPGYARESGNGGARAELIANQIGRDLEIVGMPLVSNIGGADSPWIISTNAGGNLNVRPLALDPTDPSAQSMMDSKAFSSAPADLPGSTGLDPVDFDNVNLINIAVLDTLLDSEDRHEYNSILVQNPMEGTSTAQRYQPIPIDNADNTYRTNPEVIGRPPRSIRTVLENPFAYYTAYLEILSRYTGAEYARDLVNSRLQVLRKNLEARTDSYLNQEQLDLLKSRIADFEALTVQDYKDLFGEGSN